MLNEETKKELFEAVEKLKEQKDKLAKEIVDFLNNTPDIDEESRKKLDDLLSELL